MNFKKMFEWVTSIFFWKNGDTVREDAADIAYASTKGLLALTAIAVPGIGGAVSSVMDIAISSPANKRRDKWITSLEVKISQIEEYNRTRTFKYYYEDEEFQSLFIKASIYAIQSHQDEKIDILCNAILNLNNETCTFDFKAIIMDMIGRLMPMDVSVLSFLFKNKELSKKSNNYANYHEKYRKDYHNDSISLVQIISIFDRLENLKLIVSGNMYNPSAIHVRTASVYGTGGDNNDELPYVSVTSLGEDILRAVLEFPQTRPRHFE